MSLATANAAYLAYLNKYPLLTKSITAGVLNGLNELIASLVSKDMSSFKLSLNTKIVKMIIYGACILTPISHNLYGTLNRVFGNAGKLSPAMKILQIATSLATISPIISGIFTSWLSLINNYQPSSNKNEGLGEKIKAELFNARQIVVRGLKQDYWRILRGSVTTNCVCLLVAQTYIDPQLWVVFFNCVYFVLNTYQNTKMKMQKQEVAVKKE